MAGIIQPLGHGVFGQSRSGDLKTISAVPHTTALPLTYSIVYSKYFKHMGLSYTIQGSLTSPLLIYYLVTPIAQFAMNLDSSIIRPDRIVYTPRPVTERTLLGAPLLQGYASMTWIYSVLRWSEFQKLISFYTPAHSVVLLTYPDATGTWVQRNVVMHPPSYGEMTTFSITNVSFVFTHLLS